LHFLITYLLQPNGFALPAGGGAKQRHLAGINSKPRKVLENAAHTSSPVHAVLVRS